MLWRIFSCSSQCNRKRLEAKAWCHSFAKKSFDCFSRTRWTRTALVRRIMITLPAKNVMTKKTFISTQLFSLTQLFSSTQLFTFPVFGYKYVESIYGQLILWLSLSSENIYKNLWSDLAVIYIDNPIIEIYFLHWAKSGHWVHLKYSLFIQV